MVLISLRLTKNWRSYSTRLLRAQPAIKNWRFRRKFARALCSANSSKFRQVMVSLQPHLTSLLESLPPSPLDESKLNELVGNAIAETRNKSSPENWRSQWENALRNDIFQLAVCRAALRLRKGLIFYLPAVYGGGSSQRRRIEILQHVMR